MRIFGKASKSYPQNSELRGHCGIDGRAVRIKLGAIIRVKFQKHGKGREREGTNFIKFRAHFAASGTLCPPAASAFCSQNGSGVAQFMTVRA